MPPLHPFTFLFAASHLSDQAFPCHRHFSSAVPSHPLALALAPSVPGGDILRPAGPRPREILTYY